MIRKEEKCQFKDPHFQQNETVKFHMYSMLIFMPNIYQKTRRIHAKERSYLKSLLPIRNTSMITNHGVL